MSIKTYIEVPDDIVKRAERYMVKGRPIRNYIYDAFLEWLNRKEGRDKRKQQENFVRDAERLQELLDSGQVQVPGDILK